MIDNRCTKAGIRDPYPNLVTVNVTHIAASTFKGIQCYTI